jgi:hypothetical protein
VYHRRRGRCWPGAFEQWTTCLRLSLPESPLSVGQATIIFFYIGFWRWRVGPTLFFLNRNLLPSNIIPHKQHQKFAKHTNNLYLVI